MRWIMINVNERCKMKRSLLKVVPICVFALSTLGIINVSAKNSDVIQWKTENNVVSLADEYNTSAPIINHTGMNSVTVKPSAGDITEVSLMIIPANGEVDGVLNPGNAVYVAQQPLKNAAAAVANIFFISKFNYIIMLESKI